MDTRALVLWNSVIWAAVMLACAVALQGSEAFLAVLLVLICGAAASDAVLSRFTPATH